MSLYLGDHKFGVGLSCGEEGILHAANRLLEMKGQCKLDFHAWYLDDGTIAGDSMEVAKALSIIQAEGSSRGVHLNVRKTELFCPCVDPRSQDDRVFQANIGVKMLGGTVSCNLQFCSDLVKHKIDKTLQLMESVKQLHDPQSEFLLLRSCAGVSNLYFNMRTTQPDSLQQIISSYDRPLVQFLQHIVIRDGAGFGLIQQRIAMLPMKDGGLGVHTMEDTRKYCFLSSYCQMRNLQEVILNLPPDSEPSLIFQHALSQFMQVCGLSSFNINTFATRPMKSLEIQYFEVVKKDMPSKFVMSERDTILWKSNRLDHAQDYLKAIPICGLNQTLGPRQFRAVVSYRLGVHIFNTIDGCACCKRKMDVYGDHALHCASEVGIKFRHDFVRDVISDIFYKAGVAARKEVNLGLSSDDGKDLKPVDILVYNWVNGQDFYFDVTGVSPFASINGRTFVPGVAISNAISRKRAKYLDKVSTHGYGFGVLAFSTLGQLSEDMVFILKRLRNCIANYDLNYKIGNSLF
ncbi:uncharacterized protein LOC113287446 [Papaver somniferum]|uniref:uncharacterized protein LOC113287446 n=1 Tax=Papaver somniferum TaxID=3469 RepID=UPI000E6F5B70|nr:uncharacterized protein LOC113287446 [Papaver somniferum]